SIVPPVVTRAIRRTVSPPPLAPAPGRRTSGPPGNLSPCTLRPARSGAGIVSGLRRPAPPPPRALPIPTGRTHGARFRILRPFRSRAPARRRPPTTSRKLMPSLRLPSPLCAVIAALGALPAVAGPAPAPTATSSYSAVAAEVRATTDPKADPCQDFYQYACGGWIAKTQLPPDKPYFGRGFTEIADRNREALRTILEDAGKNPGTDPDRKKLGAFYAACMDEAAIEKAGVTPLAATFAVINSVEDLPTLMAAAGKLQRDGIEVLLSTSVEGDFKNPDLYIAYLSQ